MPRPQPEPEPTTSRAPRSPELPPSPPIDSGRGAGDSAPPEGAEELFDQEGFLNGNGNAGGNDRDSIEALSFSPTATPTPQSARGSDGPQVCPPAPPLPRCPRGSTVDVIKDDQGCVVEYRCREVGTPPPPSTPRCPDPPEPPECDGELREVWRRGCLVRYRCVRRRRPRCPDPPEPPECDGELEEVRDENDCLVDYVCHPSEGNGNGNGGNGNGNGGGEPPPPGIFEGGEDIIVVLPEEINCEEWPPDEQAFCWERYGAIIEAQRRRREQLIEEATRRAALAGGGINVGASVLAGLAVYALSPSVRKQVHKVLRGIFTR